MLCNFIAFKYHKYFFFIFKKTSKKKLNKKNTDTKQYRKQLNFHAECLLILAMLVATAADTVQLLTFRWNCSRDIHLSSIEIDLIMKSFCICIYNYSRFSLGHSLLIDICPSMHLIQTNPPTRIFNAFKRSDLYLQVDALFCRSFFF